MMQQRWKSLPLDTGGNLPPLFFSYVSSLQGYEILVTDLAYVWSESLSRKQVLANASKYDTSIDPSEDDDQYLVLLQKLGDALNGESGTSLTLQGHQNRSSLRLSTKTKLPSPLEPLTWIINLSQLPQSSLTQLLFLPVLRVAASYESRMEALTEKLKDKDWALGKLFDKLEASGIDLSTVFPSLTGTRYGHGRKASTFSLASELIRGIAPFDKTAWDSEFAKGNLNQRLDENIVTELSVSISSSKPETIGEDWWAKIGQHHSSPSGNSSRPTALKAKPRKLIEPETETEDEFETHASPAPLRKPSPSSVMIGGSNEAEGSPIGKEVKQTSQANFREGNIHNYTDEIVLSSNPHPSVPSKKAKAKGIGVIGGKRKGSSLLTGKSDKSTTPDIPHHNLLERLSTDAGPAQYKEDRVSHAVKQQAAPPEANNNIDESLHHGMKLKGPRVKGGLGQIGGKKAASTSRVKERQGSSKEVAMNDEVSDLEPPKGKSRLGMIGSDKLSRKQNNTVAENSPTLRQETVQTADEPSDIEHDKYADANAAEKRRPPKSSRLNTDSSYTLLKQEMEPTKDETLEKRANKRREALKQQLELKSGPAKKKRRF
ncbi:hypothetical protein LOZ53_004024 [Ophidiomyces ophidiicola]|nr:hypothetical protein LOZ55_004584 [Ophidiomyces ophidiicola]KAI1988195.1 hypothetical protein LOZ53_004024 [Ophidiomyces ophidiicola]KAI1988704.1 hypothetical protein LOZ54_003110 [Ophidiomyces ophidiicola]KAI1999143.1 hypothetical protein LOZ51_001629 [Ophidiomyces ophidiicola]